MFQSSRHVKALAHTDVLKRFAANDAMHGAIVTRVVILTRDMVARSERVAGKAITFKDDMTISGRVKDVASLITFFRDALCHIESDRNMASDLIYVSLNVVFGKGIAANIGGFKMARDYADDVAFFVGRQRLYLHRHLLRAYGEAVENLTKFLDEAAST